VWSEQAYHLATRLVSLKQGAGPQQWPDNGTVALVCLRWRAAWVEWLIGAWPSFPSHLFVCSYRRGLDNGSRPVPSYSLNYLGPVRHELAISASIGYTNQTV
jgi:hypothetical protein